ncbi:hypothetical protein [Streptomyces sp. NPDC008125]|uniref:hypothetical protein n=1 Tax=Streptomyces sp. NPDC008125 TaxID=3364811 RepID=UPI0036EEB300
MTIVIDAKNEIKKSVAELDVRVDNLERGLRADLVQQVEGLRKAPLDEMKSLQRAARTSASGAEARAGEAVAAVAALRSDVLQLHERLDGLRGDIGKILEALHTSRPPAGTPWEPDGAHEAGDEGDSAVPPGQQQIPPEAEQEDTGETRDSPAAEDETTAPSATSDDVPADNEGALEDGQDSGAQPSQAVREGDGSAGLNDLELAALAANRDAGGSQEPDPLSSGGRTFAIVRAAGVASATLVCHRDTWEFVAAQSGSHPHFRPPALEEREDGLIAAVLSGRSLVAMILALYSVTKTALHAAVTDDELVGYADWIMAAEVYSAAARVLKETSHNGSDPVVITIDRRLRAQS